MSSECNVEEVLGGYWSCIPPTSSISFNQIVEERPIVLDPVATQDSFCVSFEQHDGRVKVLRPRHVEKEIVVHMGTLRDTLGVVP